MIRFWPLFLFFNLLAANPPVLTLQGLPMQMEWVDLDSDGDLDLVALMLETETRDAIDTFLDGESLRGTYTEETTKKKVLTACLRQGDHWEPTRHLQLGSGPVPGFIIPQDRQTDLFLWQEKGLLHLRWDSTKWRSLDFVLPPQRLINSPLELSDFAFLTPSASGDVWLVPDVHGIHLVGAFRRFVQYPAFDGHGLSTAYGSSQHVLRLPIPRQLHVDGDPYPDLVFSGEAQIQAFSIDDPKKTYRARADGVLVDLNGDRLADLVQVTEHDDVERMRDLPKMKSTIRTFLATAPLVFSEEPTADQEVPGIIFSTEEDELNMTDPFFDMNGDQRMDLAGIAIKLSVFQIAKLISLGRMKIQFLLHLSVQEEDGSFRTLANGPFNMEWNLNIRRLKLPQLAQIIADFDGDGWTDIFTQGDKNITIVPVTSKGYQREAATKIKIPKSLRDPDSTLARDINGDGKAELVVVKIKSNKTLLATLGGHE